MVVFGVVPAAGVEDRATVASYELLVVRQLGAVVENVSLGGSLDLMHRTARYRAIVEQIFAERTIVPLPCGTVFRSRASVARWLELHWSPLQDAIDFVSDRATMRVRVALQETPATAAGAASLDGHLWTTLRGLKADAIAAVPVVANADASAAAPSAACAYLIDRDAVLAFERRVASLTTSDPHLRVTIMGPLPAYDFIKMDFGG